MYEGSRGSVLEDVPTAVAVSKRRRPPQLIWLIPIVAALIGGWLAVKTYLDKGPDDHDHLQDSGRTRGGKDEDQVQGC